MVRPGLFEPSYCSHRNDGLGELSDRELPYPPSLNRSAILPFDRISWANHPADILHHLDVMWDFESSIAQLV